MMIDRENLFDAGYEAGYPHEVISYWLEIYIDTCNDKHLKTNQREFVDFMERHFASK